MDNIILGEAKIDLALKGGKLVLQLTEHIGPIAGPPVELDLNPADALALFTGGFAKLFAGKK